MHSTRRKKIEQALVKPTTCKELACIVHLSQRAAESHLRRMHEQGQVHIAGWNRTGGSMERIFKLGIGADAPKPAAYTRQERTDRWTSNETKDDRELRLAKYNAVRRKIKVHPLMAAFYGVNI